MPPHQGCADVFDFCSDWLENVVIYHSLYIGDNSGKGMSRLKLRIEKDGCHEECLCGDCGYVYEEYEVA